LGGTVLVKVQDGKTTEKDVGADDRLPVLRVTAFEAHWFARWIGGRLPSIGEWDRAAGRGQPGRQGPFDGDWNLLKNDPNANIGVGRSFKGPLSVDEKTVDVSYFGCRHMSGNGKEWTNDLQEPARRTVSEYAGRTPVPTLMVLLRGRGYTRIRPVMFANLDDDEMTADAEEAHPEIGFRVVVVPP
jgi:formylglycine-generating enzyme required for sulfatase activity